MLKNIIMVVCCLVVLFTGCKSVRPVEHTITKTDTVFITEKLIPVTIPATDVTAKFSASQLDSLLNILSLSQFEMDSNPVTPDNKTIYITDPTLRTRLSFALDSIGRMVIRCESLEKMYFEKLIQKDHIIATKDLEIREQNKSFGQKIDDFLTNGIWFLIIAIIVFTVINLLIKKFIK